MSQPHISIVIPAYRASAYLERCINSVFAQAEVAKQVILVLDGHCEKSERIGACFEDVQMLINAENQGASPTRNRGLSIATAPLVMFLDADDYLEGPLLYGMVNAFIGQSFDLVFGPCVDEYPDKRRISRQGPLSSEPMEVFGDWLKGDFLPPCSVAWRKAFLDEMGGWREDIPFFFNDDGELVCRACLHGARVGHSRHGTGVYVQHDSAFRVSRNFSGGAFAKQLILARWFIEELDKSNRLHGLVKERLTEWLYNNWRFALHMELFSEASAFQRLFYSVGGRGHYGSNLHRFGARILGFERKERLARMRQSFRTS